MGTIRPQTTLRLAVAAFTVIALLTLSGTLGAFSLQQGSDGSAQQQAWWNSKYGYRQSITVSNPTASPLRSYPVFFTVGFPFTHLSDAAAELRLVSQAGAEVPSYVLDDVSSNGYVTSAWLLAFVSLPGSSLTTFELYYGSPSAATPAYRVDSATAESQAGNLFVATPPTQPGSSSFQVTLGGTYSEQILSKVAYDPGATSGYGAVEISHTAAPVISPLRFVANVSGSVVALSSVYSAGALRYAQALVLDNDTLIIARLLTNTAQTTVSRAAFTDVVDASSLGVLGPIATSYDAASGILSTGVSGAFFGYDSGPAISSFEVGDRGKVIADSRAGALPNSLSEAGTAGALTRDLGSLAPGGSAQLMSSWGFGRTYGQLAASLRQELAQVSLTAGQEEAYTATLPQVTSSWSVQVPITNATISGGGFTVPVSLGAATPIASRLTLAGTVRYVLPTGFASPGGKGWTPQTAQNGNASAFSTTGFYSVQEQTYTDSVRVTSVSGAGSGVAQLVSPVMSFPGSVSKEFVLKYKAAFGGTGDLSSQWVYAAVDYAQKSTGPFAQTLAVPAGGTSPSTTGSGCDSLPLFGLPTSPPGATVATSGALVADGSWRSLNVSLDGALGTSAQFARMRFCVATAAGYAGQLELDVAQAGIQAKGDAPSFVSATLPQGGSALRLSFIPGATFEPSSLTFNGVVTFPAVGSAPLKWDGGTSYNGTIEGLLPGSQPNPIGSVVQGAVPKVSDVPPPAPANATLVGATIFPPPYSPAPRILINGSAVQGQPVGNVLFLKPSDIVGEGASSFRRLDVALTFAGHQMGIKAQGADGSPLSNAAITIQTSGSSPMNEPSTDASGSASLMLLPSTYAVSVSFQGVSVGSATANLTSDQTLTVHTSVYSIPLQVKNALGWPLQGAEIAVVSTSADFNLTSDGKGMASFLAVPNKEYNVSVSIEGVAYYTGTVLGSANLATTEIGTSYLPPSIQVAIIAAVALSMLVASLVVYLARRRPKTPGYASETVVLSSS